MLTRAHLACLRPLPLPHLVHPPSLSGKSPLVNSGWGMEEEEQEKEGEAEGQRSREAPRSRSPRKPQQEEEQDYFRIISERGQLQS